MINLILLLVSVYTLSKKTSKKDLITFDSLICFKRILYNDIKIWTNIDD